MNPFLEIPVCQAGKPGDPKQPEKEVTGRILPGEIAFHYPGCHWGAIVVLKSGYNFLTTLSCEDVDAARQAYDKILKQNPSATGNVQLKAKKESPIIKLAQ